MKDQKSSEQQQVAELEHNFIEACLQSVTPVLDDILADDFTFTDPNGVNLTKEEWLADLSSGDFKFEAAELEDIRVNIREGVAVVEATIRVKARSKKAGRLLLASDQTHVHESPLSPAKPPLSQTSRVHPPVDGRAPPRNRPPF